MTLNETDPAGICRKRVIGAVAQDVILRCKELMNRFAIILLLDLAALLPGCAKPDVKYSDLRPATTATIAGDTVTIHLGSDLFNSACWTRPSARVEGRTVYVVGYRTLRRQSREFAVRRPAAGAGPVTVVWVDPDGRRTPVPTRR